MDASTLTARIGTDPQTGARQLTIGPVTLYEGRNGRWVSASRGRSASAAYARHLRGEGPLSDYITALETDLNANVAASLLMGQRSRGVLAALKRRLALRLVRLDRPRSRQLAWR